MMNQTLAQQPAGSATQWKFPWRRELLVFAVLLLVFNAPMLVGGCWQSMMFVPSAVGAGEWWRVLTHPFVHVTWYHLLLDGAAFLMLYESLLAESRWRRMGFVVAGGVGSLLAAWLAGPGNGASGLCGLSGIAHGLMAVSAVEMMSGHPRKSAEWRFGFISLAMVVGKAALEAVTGWMFFSFLQFGMLGDPVAVSHAGGVIGGLVAAGLLLKRSATVDAIGN